MAEAELIRAQRYHERARRLSALAARERTEPLHSRLLELAAQYEEFCHRIVQSRLKKKPARDSRVKPGHPSR